MTRLSLAAAVTALACTAPAIVELDGSRARDGGSDATRDAATDGGSSRDAAADAGGRTCEPLDPTRTCAGEMLAQIVAIRDTPTGAGLVSVGLAASGAGLEVVLAVTRPISLGDARLPVGVFRSPVDETSVRAEVCAFHDALSALVDRAAVEEPVADATIWIAKQCGADGRIVEWSWARADLDADPEKLALQSALRSLAARAIGTPHAAAHLVCTSIPGPALECALSHLGARPISLVDPAHPDSRLIVTGTSPDGPQSAVVSAAAPTSAVEIALHPGETTAPFRVDLPPAFAAARDVVLHVKPFAIEHIAVECPTCLPASLESPPVDGV